MHREPPAALPLLGYVAGLIAGPLLAQPRTAAWLLLFAALLIGMPAGTRAANALFRTASNLIRPVIALLLSLAAGIAMSAHVSALRRAETRNFAAFDAERFVTVDAPLDRDWSIRGDSFTLRADTFLADGHPFRQPVTVYARFEPQRVGDETILRASGFLRRNDEGRYALTVKSPRLLSYAGKLSRFSPRLWNRALARRIAPLAHDHPVEVALVDALVLGRNERLTDDVREAFRHGGTYHLLVFSGLQLAVAAGFLAWLLRWLHAPRASDWLLLSFSLAGPLFIGPTASVSRASIAIGIYALSRILRRPTSLENLWCVAALARLVVAPADLSDPAFQLTYAGAGALLFVAGGKPLVAPIIAELAITPLTLFHFHQYALGGSLATAAMTPLIFAMLVAAAAVFVWPGAIHLITILHAGCTLINDVGAFFSGFHRAAPATLLASAYGAAFVAIAFSHRPRRTFAIVSSLSVAATLAFFPVRRAAEEVIALDVGQGDAIVVRSGERTILIDGGGRSGDVRFGETTLLPLLVDRGIGHLDAVFLTHAHPDHCGGLPAVLENLGTDAIWITPRRFEGPCAAEILDATIVSRTPIHLVRDGERLPLGALHLTAMTAGEGFRRSPENNSSVVLRAQVESHRILLLGDVERDAESRLIGRGLRCDILKVAHHGSRSSSTAPLLDEARPRIALISAGRHNLFGHPHREVLDALASRRIRVWRTDRSGSITIALEGLRLIASGEIDTAE